MPLGSKCPSSYRTLKVSIASQILTTTGAALKIATSRQHPPPETSTLIGCVPDAPSSAFCNRPLHTRSPSNTPPSQGTWSSRRGPLAPPLRGLGIISSHRPAYNLSITSVPNYFPHFKTVCCYPYSFISLNWPSRLNTDPPSCLPRQIRRRPKAIGLETSISQSLVWEQNILHICSIRHV
jgi:hypothetical protein